VPDNSGYLLPDNIDAPRTKCVFLCIPDDENHIAAFWGQLYELSYWWNWEGDAAKQGTLAAQVWRQIFHDSRALWECGTVTGNCDFCCDLTNELLADIKALLAQGVSGDQTVINNAIINIEIERETIYNTYISAPTTIYQTTPDTTYDFDSTDTPPDMDYRLAALCYAIDAYTDEIWRQAQNLIASSTGAAVIAAGGIGLLFGPIGGIIALVVGGTVAALLTVLNQAVFDDETARAAVRCCMYTNLIGTPTTSNLSFRAAVDTCGFVVPSNEWYLAEVIRETLSDDTNWLVFLKAIGRGFELARDGVISTYPERCLCLVERECWDYEALSRQGWVNNDGTVFDIHATAQPQAANAEVDTPVVADNGYVMRSWGSGSNFGIHVDLVTEKNIGRVKWRMYVDAPGIGTPYWFTMWDASFNIIHEVTAAYAGASGWFVPEWTFGTPIANVRYISYVSDNNWQHALDWMRINSTDTGACP